MTCNHRCISDPRSSAPRLFDGMSRKRCEDDAPHPTIPIAQRLFMTRLG